MSAGTKIFLAVVVLFVGGLVVYYSVLSPSPEAQIQTDATTDADDDVATWRNELPADETSTAGARSAAPQRQLPERRESAGPEPLQNNLARPEDQSRRRSALTPTGANNAPPRSDGGKDTPDAGVPAGSMSSASEPGEASASPATVQQSPNARADANQSPQRPGPALTRTATVDEDDAAGDADDPQSEQRSQGQAKRIAYYLYTVRSGDTLAWIAESWFGRADTWHLITAMNPGLDPDRLRVGQQIKLPPKDATRATVTGAAQPASGNTHTVQPGDTLSVIARKLLGKASAWESIYQANREVIGPDPHGLDVGMKLTIPRR